jgi:benzoyl-CoA reductase subunit C
MIDSRSMNKAIIKSNDLINKPDIRKSYLEGIRDRFSGIAGYFSNYIPEEIIAVAGFHPVRVIGSYASAESHGKTLFNPVCSFAQDMYTAACAGGMSCFDNVIFPNSCDSLKVLKQMWTSERLLPTAYTLLHPINTDPDAIHYFARQIKALAGWLKQEGGKSFSQDDLLQIIDTYNQTRSLLSQLYQLRERAPEFLAASDLFALMTAGLIMDRDQYNQILAQWLEESKSQAIAPKSDPKRMMIIGPLLDNMELLKKIESFGVCIVADEVTNGWRYFDRAVKTDGDLYHNLAERYLLSGPSPTLNTDPKMMLQSFREKVARLDLDGVLFINQKFCEPHVHNYLAKADTLKQMGIPVLMLEIEHNRPEITERDLLRIESFLEVINR